MSVEVPRMSVEVPRMPVEVPRMSVEVPRMPVEVPRMPVEVPRMPVEVPRMPVEVPREFVEMQIGLKIIELCSLDDMEPGTEAKILESDGDAIYKMEQLGDDTNPYLIIRNLENEPAEIIIEWVES